MIKYKVLIADDEPAAIHFIEKIIELKCPDLEVAATANSGLEALEILNSRAIDVVFTDIMMPEMNGVELVSEISRDYPYVCSVVVSGHQDFDYVKETLRTGAADYILKPINLKEMTGLCQTICSKLNKMYYTRRSQQPRCKHTGHQASSDASIGVCDPRGSRQMPASSHSARCSRESIFPLYEPGYYFIGQT